MIKPILQWRELSTTEIKELLFFTTENWVYVMRHWWFHFVQRRGRNRCALGSSGSQQGTGGSPGPWVQKEENAAISRWRGKTNVLTLKYLPQVSPVLCLMLDVDIIFVYYQCPPEAYSRLWFWKPSPTFLGQPLNGCLLNSHCTSFVSLTVWTQASYLTSLSNSGPFHSIEIIIVPTPLGCHKDQTMWYV